MEYAYIALLCGHKGRCHNVRSTLKPRRAEYPNARDFIGPSFSEGEYQTTQRDLVVNHLSTANDNHRSNIPRIPASNASVHQGYLAQTVS